MLGGDPCYPYPAHGNWAQLNYVVRIVAVAPKLLCMDYPGPRQHWKLLSLQTLGTKRWIKENLSTTVEKFKHCFMVFLVSFFLLVSFWGHPGAKAGPCAYGRKTWRDEKGAGKLLSVDQYHTGWGWWLQREADLSQIRPRVQLNHVAFKSYWFSLWADWCQYKPGIDNKGNLGCR